MGFARIETRRFLAREKRRAQLSEEAMEVLERELDGAPGFVGEVERHLATCMQKLGEKQRRLIQGYYHEGRSPQWLAKQGSRSVEAVYKAIQRARRDLQVCIERQTRKEFT
jgi:DNA-directed RNA polymerase specialized sigma24 family protein